MGVDQQREPDQHHAEQDPERDLGALRGAHPRLAERGHPVRDRLDAGDRRAPGRERLQDQHDPERCRRGETRSRLVPITATGWEWNGPTTITARMLTMKTSGRARISSRADSAIPNMLTARQQRQPDQRDREQVVRERGEHAAEAGRAGREADRDRQHVVDDERRRRQQRRPAAEVRLGDRVRAAALGVRRDHLRVGDHQQHQHRGDHERQRDDV